MQRQLVRGLGSRRSRAWGTHGSGLGTRFRQSVVGLLFQYGVKNKELYRSKEQWVGRGAPGHPAVTFPSIVLGLPGA